MHKILDDTHSVRYYRTEICCSVTYEQREGDEYVNSVSNFLVRDLVRTHEGPVQCFEGDLNDRSTIERGFVLYLASRGVSGASTCNVRISTS